MDSNTQMKYTGTLLPGVDVTPENRVCVSPLLLLLTGIGALAIACKAYRPQQSTIESPKYIIISPLGYSNIPFGELNVKKKNYFFADAPVHCPEKCEICEKTGTTGEIILCLSLFLIYISRYSS